MITIEFGSAEKLTLDNNSLFLKFYGSDFKINLERIKKYWNRVYHKQTAEWEVPFSCWEEIKELYADTYIQYINEPPKAKFVTDDDILNGLDFNGFNLYDYQLEGVRFGLNHHNFLLLDEQGLGKAQPYGSKIYTPSGITQIEKLNIGDYVLGIKGKTKVVGVYDRGKLPVYKITFNDNTYTLCSNDHLWTIYKKMNDNKSFTVDTNYLLKNYKTGAYIPMIQNADFDEQYTPIDPYILGVLLGNGSFSGGYVGFSVNKQDYTIKQNIDNMLDSNYICVKHFCKSKNCNEYRIINKNKNFITSKYIYYIDDMQVGNCVDLFNYLTVKNYIKWSLTTFKSRLSDYFGHRYTKIGNLRNLNIKRIELNNRKSNMYKSKLLDMGLYGCKSEDKYIPDIYKYNTYDKRLRLLQGLLDTDGSVTKDGVVSYSSVSYKLLCDIKELAESFGAKVRFKYKKNYNVKAFGKEYTYTKPTEIVLTFPDNFICCTSQRKINRLHIKRDKRCYYKVLRKITNIEYIGEQLCRCIKVDSVDGLYATNNFIITHNTLQLLTLARYKKQHRHLKHCLIICGLNSLKFNWVKEVNKFCKDESAVVLGTRLNTKGKIVNMTIEETKQQIESCPPEFFWIINIEKIRLSDEDKKNKTGIVNYFNEQIELGNLGMVVCDEIHKCKNSQSQQGKGLMEFDSRADRIGMTGTLLVNNPYDLYTPMLFTGLINYNKWLFEKKFVIKDDWGKPMGYQNMNELHEILYKSSLRRTKDLLDLPPKMYKQEWLEFSSEEQSVFDAVIGNGNMQLLDKIEPPFDMFAKLTRMRQATTACELLCSKCHISTKFERLNDILEEARLNGQKVLVFCQFTEGLKLGLKYCAEYQPKLVCGGMGAQVQAIIDEHENTNGFSVIFAQEATLGAGFTLTNTEICVFITPPWNKATYDQCCDRIHRIGQKKTVQIIDLLIKDSYDELVYLKLHGKGAMSDALIDGKMTPEIQEMFRKMGIEFSDNEAPDLTKLF